LRCRASHVLRTARTAREHAQISTLAPKAGHMVPRLRRERARPLPRGNGEVLDVSMPNGQHPYGVTYNDDTFTCAALLITLP
jgi:hypothetical protein